MSYSYNVSRAVVANSGTVSKSKQYTYSKIVEYSDSVSDGTTDDLVDLAFALAQLKVVYLASDQAITIKTNSSGAPQETINLLANVPLLWTEDDYQASSTLFAGDVTALYLTNGSGSAAAVEMRVLLDGTP